MKTLSIAESLVNNADSSRYITIILIAAVIVILAATAIILGYFAIYKRRINKALKSGGKVKAPRLTPGGTAVSTLVVIWVACTIISFAMMGAISAHVSTIDMRSYATLQQTESLYDNQNDVFYCLEQLDKKTDAKNITTEYQMETGAYHAEDNTVALRISVRPRLVLGKNDKLTFTVGDSAAVLQSGDLGYYHGEVRIPTYAYETSGLLTLETNGQKFSQILSDREQNLNSEFSNEWADYYPYVDTDIANIVKEQNSVSEDITIQVNEPDGAPGKTFTQLSLVFETDGKIIREVDLMKDSGVKKGGSSYTCHYSDTPKDNHEIHFYVTGKDNLGYGYLIDHGYLVGKGKNFRNTNEPPETASRISNPDGLVVIETLVYPESTD